MAYSALFNNVLEALIIRLKGQCHEIFCFGFFDESASTQPQSIALGPLRIFSKIRGDNRKSRCTTGINDGGKIAAGINDTGGKFFHTGVNDTGGKFGKFATGVNDAGGKLLPVSTTPAANLPPVANNGYNIRLQSS
jgi:hypothetical protein